MSSIIVHDSEKNLQKNNSIEKELISFSGHNKLYNDIKCTGQNNTVRFDRLIYETTDIENIIDGSEIAIYFDNEVNKGDTIRNIADTNATGLKTIFEPNVNGVYYVHCYLHLVVNFSTQPITAGTFYDGILKLYLNDVEYSWVNQTNLAVNTSTGAVNFQNGTYDINLFANVPMLAGEQIYLGFEAAFNKLWDSTKLSDYDIWGNLNIGYVNCLYNYSAQNTNIYEG